jgi:hypothetical protein
MIVECNARKGFRGPWQIALFPRKRKFIFVSKMFRFLAITFAIGMVNGVDIHEAVRSNDMSKVKDALASGEDINKIGN